MIVSGQKPQLLINAGDDTFNDTVEVPSSFSWIYAVAIGDMDNGGILDIVIGNWSESNQLPINNGDGTMVPLVK
jgi:hypothetical protein